MDYLIEKTKAELINKSISADKTKSYGTTRWERRNKLHIEDSLRLYNSIDFNALFHSDLFSFKIPVHGETNNYEVEILFDGVCRNLKREIKNNKGVLDLKCVYRAIMSALSVDDLYVSCTCPDEKYRMAYHSTKGRYYSGAPETRPSNKTNPNDTKGAGCKHIMSVLGNLFWVVKLSLSVYNYITYMEKNFREKYAKYMFPKLFDGTYKATHDLPEDDELANSMDNPEDAEEIDQANKEKNLKEIIRNR